MLVKKECGLKLVSGMERTTRESETLQYQTITRLVLKALTLINDNNNHAGKKQCI